MRILLYPALKKAEGSGHLRRSLTLLQELGDDAQLLCDESGCGRGRLLRDLGFPADGRRVRRRIEAGDAWDLIVLDRRQTARADLERLGGKGCLVGLDEGGRVRSRLPFLIDTLPGGVVKHEPNVRALQLPAYPAAARDDKDAGLRNVLISFGGEDAAHLSERLLGLLSGAGYGFQSITVVEGPLFGPRSWPEGVRVLRSPPRLVDEIPAYDLVFCSFGLTCFEALAGKVPVILFNPTALHRRLSRRLGLPEIGVGSPRAGKLRRLLAQPELLRGAVRRTAELFASGEERLSALLPSLKPPRQSRCPLCGAGPDPALARFPRRTYVRCRACGLVYLLSFESRREVYGEDYFFEEYRSCYGRTYLEDFPAIKQRAAGRLARIERRFKAGKNGGRRLLDVGGAYGAFQQAAQEKGFHTLGLEISAEGCRYARETLGLECWHDDFESTTKLTAGSFDVLTMWFVIEHFQDTAAVLTRAARLLRPGGVFAFSTTNGSGISARNNRTAFLRTSPDDHYSLWFPARVKRQLGRFGFKVREIRITGHHPERFPLPEALRIGAGPLLALVSRVLRLGDTFEVYAVKSGQAGGKHACR